MKKSKHFRKDVILARIIAGVLLIVLIVLLAVGVSLLKKTSGDNNGSQNTQNSENLLPGDKDTQQDTEDESQQEESTGGEEETQGTEENNSTEELKKVYIKTTATLRLRVEPNTSCETLAHIPEGTKLEAIEKTGIWYKVSYDGKTGYVSGTYVEVVEE